jgi:hypothetical protein
MQIEIQGYGCSVDAATAGTYGHGNLDSFFLEHLPQTKGCSTFCTSGTDHQGYSLLASSSYWEVHSHNLALLKLTEQAFQVRQLLLHGAFTLLDHVWDMLCVEKGDLLREIGQYGDDLGVMGQIMEGEVGPVKIVGHHAVEVKYKTAD